jgi:hypothetical protein
MQLTACSLERPPKTTATRGRCPARDGLVITLLSSFIAARHYLPGVRTQKQHP